MKTLITSDVLEAARVLREDGVLLQATEGVWGFACNPLSRVALDRVISLKRRDERKGFILISHDLQNFVSHMQGVSHRRDIEMSWPGPHTWILPNNNRFDMQITGGRDTVACRVPGHLQTREVCAAFGGIVISTSANISGLEPVTTEEEAIAKFSGSVDCILKGRVDMPGQASTIHGLDLNILRDSAQGPGKDANG
ncbi:MAG: L-threonylcarbamoyladenylate synthase [Pseudomonadota bacterium]